MMMVNYSIHIVSVCVDVKDVDCVVGLLGVVDNVMCYRSFAGCRSLNISPLRDSGQCGCNY